LSGDALSGAALRRRTRALTTPRGLFLAAALLLCALPVIKDVRDPDFWWHVRTGELILDRGSLLGTDPYTYTVSSHHWTMHEWLWEVLVAGLHRVGGLALVVVAVSLVTWAGLVLLYRRAALRRPHHVALGIGMIVAVVTGSPIWGPRVQMLTFALTCLVLLVVERHLRGGGRAVWLLVPVFLVWSNLHSGFVIGAGFIVLVLAAELVAGRLGWRGAAPHDRVVTLIKVLAACAAVVVLNPNGPGIYLYPFETQGSAAQQALIQEWHSPDFHDASLIPLELMLLSLAVMVTVTRTVNARDAVLALATTALALQSTRHIVLFVAAATPLWVEQADIVGRRIAAGRRPPGVRAAVASAPVRPPRAARALAWTVLGGLSAGILLTLGTGASTREDSLSYARSYPVCATRWLQASPAGLHIFNQYGEGGYLADKLYSHGDRVFIFGDAALMGDDMLQRYGAVEDLVPGWEAIIRDSGTDLVLFDAGASLTNLLERSPRWIRVYQDPYSEAFVPATEAGQALMARLAPQPVFAPSSSDTCAQLQHQGAHGTTA